MADEEGLNKVQKNIGYKKSRKIALLIFRPYLAVLRIHDILGWIRIRIRGSMPLTNGSGDPDPAIFVIDLQDASKN